tara:strand:- start:44 stop:655 length:612 start_codon:yes stop_codon:yes gene_type:complete
MNKTCITCGEVKPIGEYRKGRNQCKACRAEYSKQYSKQWRQDNKEHIKQYRKQWRQDNKEHIKQYGKQYSKQWRQDNKEYDKQRKKQHYQDNKEAIIKENIRYVQNLSAATYLIMNTINGKVYIGQSTQYSRRWADHRIRLRKNKHENKHLQRDYDEHGKDAFVFEVIEELPPDTSSELLLEKEREQIIEHLKRDVILYNTLN